MFRNFVILLAALVVCSFVPAVGIAQGTSIPLVVNNPSFEEGNFSAQSTDLWGDFSNGTLSGTEAYGWTGYWNPSVNNAWDCPIVMNNGGNPYGYPTPPDGTHVATLRGTSTDHACALAQELTTDGTTPYEFANAGDTVTVSVYAESRSEATDFDIELWSGGSPATGAEIGNSGPIAMAALGQSGPYSLESYTYTATAADVGEVLWFAFRDMTTLSDDLANLTLDLVSASYTPTSTAFHPGDANLDGKVDINDLTIVLSNFGSTGCAWSQGCMDGDPTGTVDVNDLTIVLANFGTTYGASSNIKAVPEPSTITLLLASAACLLAFAWRRPTA